MMPDFMGEAKAAERALIGAILLDGERIADVRDILSPEDFLVPEYCDVYKKALSLYAAGEKVDYLTAGAGVEKAILFCAMDAVPYTKNAAQYAKTVKDEAMRRALMELSDKIGGGIQGGEDTQNVLEAVSRFAKDISAAGQKDRALSSREAMLKYIEYRRELDTYGRQFVATGFRDLDKMLGGGLVNAGFYVVAARPGMGKTTLASAIADNVAKAKKKVLFYSLEMTSEQMSARRIGRCASIPYTRLMLGELDGDEYEKVMMTAAQLSEFPLNLAQEDRLTVEDVRAGAAEEKPDLIVIDYLGLMTPSGKRKTRYEETTELSGELKRLAKSLKIPILCLCQLNRENVASADKRPKLSQLRDSGAIEQDADGVILLHRPAYYEEGERGEREEIELIVAKNRHGMTGSVNFLWYGATGIIRSIWRGSV